MAVATNTIQEARNPATRRENVMDMIYNIDPTDTPLLSMLPRGTTKSTEKDVIQDTFPTPSGDNKTLQGDRSTYDPITTPVKRRTYTQISDKGLSVSLTARAVAHYGYGDEFVYQHRKKVKELKLDMESRLAGNYGSVKALAGTEGETASVAAWIEDASTNTEKTLKGNFISLKATNKSTVGGYATATSTTAKITRNTTGDDVAFTEQNIRDLVLGVAKVMELPNVSHMIMSLGNKERFSRKVKGLASFRADVGMSMKPLRAIGVVDEYKSDFGVHRVYPDRWLATWMILFLNTRYWTVDYLQQFQKRPLAVQGHSDEEMIWAEYMLCSKMQRASAMLADVTDGGGS